MQIYDLKSRSYAEACRVLLCPKSNGVIFGAHSTVIGENDRPLNLHLFINLSLHTI